VLVDGKNFRALHQRWFLGFLIASGLAIGCYVLEARTSDRWPGGGSRIGLILGIATGLIIFFECAIVLRKTSWFRARRWIGSGKFWMKAHIWLGLLTVPLAFLHSGFRWGGPFTTLLMVCFCTVIVTFCRECFLTLSREKRFIRKLKTWPPNSKEKRRASWP
jgi:hypothetical protein